MRKAFLFMLVSLDGYIEGKDHDLSWHNVDEEFNIFANKQLDESDTLVFGARTYEMMADFWPSEFALKNAEDTAKRMNSMAKIVFSSKLDTPKWNNTKLYRSDPAKVIRKIKKIEGKDIAILGSSNLCISLLNENVLDELRIMINPVVIGKGTPLFEGFESPIKLSLANQRVFKSGNILLTYKGK